MKNITMDELVMIAESIELQMRDDDEPVGVVLAVLDPETGRTLISGNVHELATMEVIAMMVVKELTPPMRVILAEKIAQCAACGKTNDCPAINDSICDAGNDKGLDGILASIDVNNQKPN